MALKIITHLSKGEKFIQNVGKIVRRGHNLCVPFFLCGATQRNTFNHLTKYLNGKFIPNIALLVYLQGLPMFICRVYSCLSAGFTLVYLQGSPMFICRIYPCLVAGFTLDYLQGLLLFICRVYPALSAGLTLDHLLGLPLFICRVQECEQFYDWEAAEQGDTDNYNLTHFTNLCKIQGKRYALCNV